MNDPELTPFEEKQLEQIVEADMDFCKENAYLKEIVKANDATAWCGFCDKPGNECQCEVPVFDGENISRF